MRIFEIYTGNAMLNNALMTIEALGNLKHVSEITPDILLQLYKKQNLKELNKRLKSYTMLFTKNGPLHNDTKNGLKIYDGLFNEILGAFINEGDKTCEISGLKFKNTFEQSFRNVLKNIGLNDKEIKKKDTSINRNWFPLIGGLGSDAQALPQAKFAVQIHPICIVIMQFLPLSTVLYKKGQKSNILLIDSSNFDFCREFVARNTKRIFKEIELTKGTKPIENIKDLKGNHLLSAIKILEEKEIEDEYSNLNLWAFTNSGTGASCEIDRVPDSLIKKVIRIKINPNCNNQLESILSNSNLSDVFLKNLEDNKEWFGLYPSLSKKGKKVIPYEGVTIPFLEDYYKEIGSMQKIEYAKYLAYLIDKYKSENFKEILIKTDAWKEKNYKSELYSILSKAVLNGEWNLEHHLKIIDDNENLPIKNSYYGIHKIIHYYYQKKGGSSKIPTLQNTTSETYNICRWLISLIQNDERVTKISRELANAQSYSEVGYSELLLRSSKYSSLDLETIIYSLYNENLNLVKYGLNELLHLFFLQPEQEKFELKELPKSKSWTLDYSVQKWFELIKEFVQDYQDYYYDKYGNREADNQPHRKFLSQIMSISENNGHFLKWYEEATENTNNFLKKEKKIINNKWTEALLYKPSGEFATSISKFAIKFYLLKQYYYSVSVNKSLIIN